MAKLTPTATYTDTELLALWREAFARISVGHSYRIGSRTMTKADVEEVRKMISWLEQRVEAEASGPITVDVRRKRAT